MQRTALILVLLAAQPAAAQFMSELGGHWFNPEQDGHGLTVNVVDVGRTVAYWYVYDELGNPDWYLLDGLNFGPAAGLDLQHRVEGSMWQCEGMRFGDFDPDLNQCVEVGEFNLEFADCGVAAFRWTLDGDSRQMPLQRLSHLQNHECPPFVSRRLRGDWSASTTVGPIWPTQGQWFDVTIDPTGYFEFTDESDCLWSGRIRERGDDVRLSYRNHQCGWDIEPLDLPGSYISPFILCSSGGTCVEYPAAMGFQGIAWSPDLGEPFDVHLRFFIPPESD